MSYKRIFVAVGTTAIEGLKNYVLRLKEENHYEKANTVFIGIDSDVNFLKGFQSLDSNRNRIDSIPLQLAEEDSTSRLVRDIYPNWPKSIQGAGVGGDRRLSFTSLNWEERIGEVFGQIEKDAEAYLIGSCFGGTSTGVYFNIGTFIREQIYKITKENKWKNQPIFNSLLLFPKSQRFGDNKYPLGRNICAFLKEMQMLVWNRRIVEECRGEIPFKSINYSGLTRRELLPLFSGYMENQAKTNAPFDTIIAVPTPLKDKSFQKEAVTELLLCLSNIGLASKLPGFAVNLSTNNRVITRDEKFFAGLNLIVARNAKNAAIKRFSYNALKDRWDAFRNGKSAGQDRSWISNHIRSLMDARVDDAANKALEERENKTSDEFKSTIDKLRNSLPAILSQVKTLAMGCPYVWPSKEELVRKIASSANDTPPSLSLDGICQAYNAQLDYVKRMSLAANDIATKMNTLAEKASKIIKIRSSSRIASVLGAKRIVQKEVEEKLAQGLSEILVSYVDACRCEATVRMGRLTNPISPDDFFMDPKIQKISETIGERLSVTASAHAEFICEAPFDANGQPLQVIDTGKINSNQLILKALSGDLIDFDSIFADFEGDSIDKINRIAEERGAANPLKDIKTVLNMDNTTSYTPAFSISKTNSYDISFFIQNGLAQKSDGTAITLEDINKKFESFNHELDTNYKKPIEQLARDNQNWIVRTSRKEHDLSGIWMGSLSLDFNLSGILSKLYDKDIARTWASDSADDERTAQYRFLTLKQSVLLGMTLGTIEKKISNEIGERTLSKDYLRSIKVKVKTMSAEITWEIEPNVFVRESDRIEMKNCPVELLKNILSWLKGSFETDMEIKGAEKLGAALMFEESIFDSITFGIEKKIIDQMKELSQRLRNRISIEFVER